MGIRWTTFALAALLAAGPSALAQAAPPGATAAPGDDENEERPRGLVGIFIFEDDDAPGGAKIERVKEGSPAAQAGLKPGDVVVAFNGEKVKSSAALAKRLAKVRAGDELRLEVERDGWRKELRIKAAPHPDALAKAAAEEKPFLGVGLEEAGDALVISEIVPDGPAARAGLKVGDKVISIRDRAARSMDAVVKALEGRKPGDTVAVLVERDGWRKEVKVTLGKRPGSTAAAPPPLPPPPPPPTKAEAKKKPGFLGVYLKNQNGGLVVESVVPGSPAERAGLKPDDVIVTANGHPVRDLDGFTDHLRALGAGDKVTLAVRREGWTRTLEVTLGEKPDRTAATPNAPAPPALPKAEAKPGFLGIEVEETDRGLEIVRVVPGSPAEKAGLKAGEELASPKTIDDLAKELRERKAGEEVVIAVVRDGQVKQVTVTLAPRE